MDYLIAFQNILVTPIVLWRMLLDWMGYLPFLSQLAHFAAVTFLILFLVLCLMPRLTLWTLSISLTITLLVCVSVAEDISKILMCRTALERGVSSIARRDFRWSLRHAPQEYQFEIHAFIRENGQRLGWSYRDLDWYSIPEEVHINLEGSGILDCRL